MPEPCRSGCQKKAIAIAVRNVSGRRRWSKLGEWLRPRAPVSRQTSHGKSTWRIERWWQQQMLRRSPHW
jgi:hypothetical protein